MSELLDVISVNISSQEGSSKIRELVEATTFLGQQAYIFEPNATFARVFTVIIDIDRDDFRRCNNIVVVEKQHNLVINWREPRYTFNHLLQITIHHDSKDDSISFYSFDVRTLNLTTYVVRYICTFFSLCRYGSNLADPSLSDGFISETKQTPMVGHRARVDFRERGTKAMYENETRDLESLESTDEVPHSAQANLDTIGQARMHLAQSVTRSSDGDDLEARRHIRESMQLLDVVLEEVNYGE